MPEENTLDQTAVDNMTVEQLQTAVNYLQGKALKEDDIVPGGERYNRIVGHINNLKIAIQRKQQL